MRIQQLILAFVTSIGLITSVHANDAVALVDRTAAQLIEAVQSSSTAPDSLVAEMGAVLDPVVDFTGIARGVMGKNHYGAATDDQRARFAGVFRDSLVDTLAQALSVFGDVTTNVKAGKGDGVKRQSVLVNARTPDGNSFDVVFAMGTVGAEWKVKNLTFDGVNMGLSFRNQFAASMTQRGNDIDAVIDNWAVLEEGN